MQEARIIKSITETRCPGCGKSIMVAIRMTAPVVEWVLEPKALEDAKEKMKKELENITFKSEESKKEVLNWLADDRTIFGPAEIPSLIDQLKAENEEKEVKK